MKNLKTGLLIHQDFPSRLDLHLIALSKNSSKYSIDLIIKYYEKKSFLKDAPQKFIFIILILVEKFLYKKNRLEDTSNIIFEEALKEIKQINVTSTIDDHGNSTLSNASEQLLKDQELDLIVCRNSSSSLNNLANLSRYGLIRILFGENDQRLSEKLIGFAETAMKKPTSSFQILSFGKNKLHSPQYESLEIFTTFPFSINSDRLKAKSIYFLHNFIESSEVSSSENKNIIYSASDTLIRSNYPSLRSLLNAFLTLAEITLAKILSKFTKKYHRWGIGFAKVSKSSPMKINEFNIIQNKKNHYLADPFLIKKNNLTYCFAEDFNYLTQKGVIRAFQLNDKGYDDLGVVLKEQFHLSYPNIFEVDENLYMCPETSENKKIQLYKCEDFPMGWRHYKTLIDDISAADTNIFKHDELWWLFTNVDTADIGDHQSELHIFYAKTFDSESWTPHKQNPVIKSSLQARNAGFASKDKSQYRVFQRQDFNFYGRSIGIAKINSLNINEYEEEVINFIHPNFIKNIQGTHHLHRTEENIVLDFNRFETLD